MPKKKPAKQKISREKVKRCFALGSINGLDGWLDRFIDELAKEFKWEVVE